MRGQWPAGGWLSFVEQVFLPRLLERVEVALPRRRNLVGVLRLLDGLEGVVVGEHLDDRVEVVLFGVKVFQVPGDGDAGGDGGDVTPVGDDDVDAVAFFVGVFARRRREGDR